MEEKDTSTVELPEIEEQISEEVEQAVTVRAPKTQII